MIAAIVLAAATLAIPSPPKHFVTDRVMELHTATADKIEAELRDFQQKTGDQIIVYIDDSTGSVPLEQWTVAAAQAWKVGQKGKDNGAILFVFTDDRKVRIEVGYGLESALTDAQSAQIIREIIVPQLRDGHPDQAIQDGGDAMLHDIDAVSGPPAPPHRGNIFTTIGHAIGATFRAFKYIVGAIILLFIIFYFVFGESVTWLRRGKKHGDWMDDFMFPVAADIAAGEKYGSGGGRSSGGFGGGGGGGFSGGGGSFGGGGASGGW